MTKFDDTSYLDAIKEAVEATIAEMGFASVRALSMFPSAQADDIAFAEAA